MEFYNAPYYLSYAVMHVVIVLYEKRVYILQEFYNSRFIVRPKSILVKVHKKYGTVHCLCCTLGVLS